ncbi:hypothetical protein ACFO0N_04280 [Halobium salinum]|uniref:Uncharacterized protein n=1 Tax=Halobium salinum TaxID=1364940 RepID=A0ABD5P8S9_9EURY|nr:hypothetical protein [Halobium salinum]
MNDHPVVVKLLFTVAALLVAGVGLALLEPGNPDNTAMLNVFASLAIVLAYTVVAASVVVGAVMASQWLIGRGRTAA